MPAGLSSAAQPTKRCLSRSAQRPADASSNAERKRRKLNAEIKSIITVEYICLGWKTIIKRKDIDDVISILLQAKLQNVDVINVSFASKSIVDSLIKDIKEQIIDAGNHDDLFQYRTRGRLLTLFSSKCGTLVEEPDLSSCTKGHYLPSICLTFVTPSLGMLSIINAWWPDLPSVLQTTMLSKYVKVAFMPENCIGVIGGDMAWGATVHSVIDKIPMLLHRMHNDRLCLLAKALSLHIFWWAVQSNADSSHARFLC